MRGVFLDAGSVDADDVDFEPLESVLELARRDQTPPEGVIEALAGAAVAITNKVPLGAAEFDALPELELVCVAATGVDHVDLERARDHGVTVCNARDYATASVAEHTLALILALNGRLGQRQARVHAGDWSRSAHFALIQPPVRELDGRRLGVIGHGVLGQAVARRARGLGMEVLIAERRGAASVRPGRHAFETVLAEAHVVTLHCPLVAGTRGLIDRDTLALMRPGALLVNTARGGLVDPAALVQALEDGVLGGAAIDVVEPEPPPPDHALLQVRRDDLIVTAHCAWASREARQRLIDQLADLVACYRGGEPRHQVS